MNANPFRLDVRRHPNATDHSFCEAFRPLSEKGRTQLTRLIPELLENGYDQILCTPTVRTMAVADGLIAVSPHLANITSMVEWVYPQPSQKKIWEMFKSTHGHAPAAFSGHKFYPIFQEHCTRAAKKLIESGAGNPTTLLLSHGVISQEILGCVADALSVSEIAETMREIDIKECEGVIFNWDGSSLSYEYVPLGEAT